MNFNIPSIKGCESTTFYYSGIKDWNSLPESVKNCNNKNRFKTNVKKYLMEKLKKTVTKVSLFYTDISQALVSFKKMYALSSSLLKEEKGAYIFLNETSACEIYHVWEGYLRKIPVERRTISRAEWRGKFSLGKFFVSRLVFFANTPPKHDISV